MVLCALVRRSELLSSYVLCILSKFDSYSLVLEGVNLGLMGPLIVKSQINILPVVKA